MPKLDIGTAFFLLLAAVFANQIFMRWTDLWKRPRLFWLMQAFNAAVGGVVVIFGLPGFTPGSTTTMVLGGLFVFRIVVNISQFQQWHRAQRMAVLADAWERERADLAKREASAKDDAGPS